MRALLLSFLSPCGRIGRLAFWWRQLLLTVLISPCCYHACYIGLQMYGSSATTENAGFAPSFLAQAFAPTFVSSTFSYAAAYLNYTCKFDCAFQPSHYTPTGFELMPGIPALLFYAAALLAGWSSLALMLRRLRDTRVGPGALPLCLTSCWYLLLTTLHLPEWLEHTLVCLPLLASLIFSLLPSRRES